MGLFSRDKHEEAVERDTEIVEQYSKNPGGLTLAQLQEYVQVNDIISETEQTYYCGLCRGFMPISHFPH
jgi:hypothetical protein